VRLPLGFAIERTPGFDGQVKSWLPNRIGFEGPAPENQDFPSNTAPIQKFYWWDARIDTKDRGTSFDYRITPMVGTPANPTPLAGEVADVTVHVPLVEENGITTHFNRAVVSSQAFARKFPALTTASQQKAARAWLANGLEQAVPQFLDRAAGKDIEGAIYHLTDDTWIIPALRHYGGAISLAYNQTSADHASDAAIQQLQMVTEMNADFALAHFWLGRAYQEKRRYNDAIAEFRRIEAALHGWPVVSAAIGHVHGVSGRTREALETLDGLERLRKERYVTPYGVALVHAGLGDKDEALAWLSRALVDRSHWLVWLKLDPRLDALRSDRRYADLLLAVGLQ